MFLSSLKRLKASEARLVLSCLNEEVRETFDTAGFSPLFEINCSLHEVRSCLVPCG